MSRSNFRHPMPTLNGHNRRAMHKRYDSSLPRMLGVCSVPCSMLCVGCSVARHTTHGAITAYSHETPSYSFELLSTFSRKVREPYVPLLTKSNHNIFLQNTQCLRIQRFYPLTISLLQTLRRYKRL